MRILRKPLNILCAMAFIVLGGGVNADDDRLTGDWGGSRSRMEASGATFAGAFKTDIFSMDGGIQDDKAAMYHTELGVEFDLEALAGLTGWSAFIDVIDDRGDTINEDSLGSLLGVSNIEVYPGATRIDHAWIQKTSEDGRLAVLLGLYPVDSEFSAMDTAGMFSNAAFGPPADLSLTDTPSIFPTSAFGMRVIGLSADETGYVMAAILDGVAGDPDDAKKTTIDINSDDGAFGIIEFGLTPAREDEGPSKFAIGVWGYSQDGDEVKPTQEGEMPDQGARWGAYVLADQRLWVSDLGTSLDAFARLSVADKSTTALKGSFSAGVAVNGPLRGRPDDILGVAYTRGDLSHDYQNALEAEGVDPASYEDTWEIGYRAQINGWLVLQPLVQLVHNPAADKSIDDATILGARVEINF